MFEIHTGKSTAHLSGNYNTQGQSAVVHLKLNGSALPMADIEGLLPALGVMLPSGARLQGGTADADLAIDGAVEAGAFRLPPKAQNGLTAGKWIFSL